MVQSNDEHRCKCALLDLADLHHIVGAAFVGAIGVMLALVLAAALWPAPGLPVGSHPVVLDSQLAQLLLEPREKGFLGLAILLGGSGACAALMRRKPLVRCNERSLAMLVALVPLFAVFCNRALNEPAGVWWACAGTTVTAVLAAGAAWVTRHA